ncbi:hypothetical protein LTR85_001215 [Meristemomyces frigidus]|nr:hypothetical protein LTR85_001215 [Meristemomyces frigidus]
MPLCEYCQHVSLDEMRGPDLDRMQTHQPSYWALKTSAANGCQLCGFFWQSFAYDSKQDYQDDKRAAMASTSERYPGRQISLVAWGGASAELDRIHVITTGDIPSPTASEDGRGLVDPTMHPDHAFGLNGVVDLYAESDDAAAWHGGVTGRPLPGAAGSDEDYATIESWYERCQLTHSACPRATEGRLPRRVIDVGASFTLSEPYLVETDGSGTARYITLSHCWGGHVALTTTTATLKDRKHAIPMSALPKTFADAVEITRRLHVRYLWVDSLCILQDSKADWEEQSAVMCDIYANGYLNIAARAADNATVGCLIPRRRHPPACPLKYVSSDESVRGTMYVRTPDFRPERLTDTPLDKRGWVLQERILSPRIVYFGADQLYWECASATYRQDGKHHDASTDAMRSGEHFKAALDVNATLPLRCGSHFNPRFWQWYKLVRQYTRRSLTYDTDMLPAASGIAKAFQAELRSEYIGGIWKDDLVYGLAWRKMRPGNAIVGSRLPTWTWARVTGDTQFSGHVPGLRMLRMSASCVILDVSYDSAGANPFGEVMNARLCLWARMIAATYDPGRTREESSLHRLQGRADMWDAKGRPVGRLHLDCRDGLPMGSVIYCLLLCSAWKNPWSKEQGHRTMLALRTSNAGQDHFRRVGCITTEATEYLFDADAPFRNVKPRVVVLV